MKYILITPAKNEEKTIQQVIHSVVDQSVQPLYWIIVDDCSTDKTLQKIQETTNEVRKPWIHYVSKTVNPEYNWLGYSNVILAGLEEIPDKVMDEAEYIALLDADITIDSNYFEKQINYLKSNPTIGVVCGAIMVKNHLGKWLEEDYTGPKNPRGAARVYLKEALSSIGGFPNTPSPDRVSDIKLRINNWQTLVTPDSYAYQHRESFGRSKNPIEAQFIHGKSRYVLGFSPLHVFFISAKMLITKSPVILAGVAFFAGYISGFLKKAPRIYDKQITEYSRAFYKRIL